MVWERARVSQVEAFLAQLLEERARVADAAEGRDRPRRRESIDADARMLFLSGVADSPKAARAYARDDDARARQSRDLSA